MSKCIGLKKNKKLCFLIHGCVIVCTFETENPGQSYFFPKSWAMPVTYQCVQLIPLVSRSSWSWCHPYEISSSHSCNRGENPVRSVLKPLARYIVSWSQPACFCVLWTLNSRSIHGLRRPRGDFLSIFGSPNARASASTRATTFPRGQIWMKKRLHSSGSLGHS